VIDAYPEFVRTFGTRGADGTYQVPARWQAGLSNGANVGAIIGLIVSDHEPLIIRTLTSTPAP
jgi:hypothetical protein